MIVTTSTYIEPLHEVRDADKLAELVASMEADGWTGTPVVVAGLGSGVVRALVRNSIRSQFDHIRRNDRP